MTTVVDRSDEILFTVEHGVGRVTLNRPKALNALTRAMVGALDRTLIEWAREPSIAAVVIAGAGERAFCAGGDIRALYQVGPEGASHWVGFFAEEYRLNRRIKRYPKPYVAIIDGTTMGGGVGLSVHGRRRVATERTLFAMPETGIGFFPDVGGSYFLPRCPGRIGMYLALTGARLGPEDTLYAGIATDFVPAASLARLDQAFAAMPVEQAIRRFAVAPGPAPLAALRQKIDDCFGEGSIEAIIAKLEQDGGGWAADTLSALRERSPISLKVTQRLIRDGAALDIEGCLRMEYRLSQRFMVDHDFYEGVRAAVIEKDNQPKWRPALIEDVTEAMVDVFFAPFGPDDRARELDFPEAATGR